MNRNAANPSIKLANSIRVFKFNASDPKNFYRFTCPTIFVSATAAAAKLPEFNPQSDMSIRLIVTRPSLQIMAEKMDRHQSEKMSAQREAKVAKEWGDLSENAEYKASKEKFRLAGRLQQRMVREFKKLESSGYQIVDPLDWTKASLPIVEVTIGSIASVTQQGYTEEFLIVGAKDQHLPMDGPVVPVPYTSPLGQALMSAKATSTIEAIIAGEKRSLKIGALRAPTPEEVFHFYPELAPEP